MFPSHNKIVFLSRQSDKVSLDFNYVIKELQSEKGDAIEIITLCRSIKRGVFNIINYNFYILRCMYHMSTARVCILDSYSIPISLLKHKKDLKIIQIWHAAGALKKFGFQCLGKNEGRDIEISKLMKMHQNYTYIICASNKTKEFYSEAFNCEKDKIIVLGMPRIDYILNNKSNNEKIIKRYPKFANKKTILYVPTFRKNKVILFNDLINQVNKEKYNLIIKAHPLNKNIVPSKYRVSSKFNTYDLLRFADYIITDYSAVSFEASLLNKPLYFYVYDIEEYEKDRGLNIDLFKEMSCSTSKNINVILNKIEYEKYDFAELLKFRSKYIETIDTLNTKRITNFILKCLEGKIYEEDEKMDNRYSKEESIV